MTTTVLYAKFSASDKESVAILVTSSLLLMQPENSMTHCNISYLAYNFCL
jgi:hypothetical protein